MPYPAAPQGLGNFKGVMLCNRPTEPGQGPAAEGDGGPLPFRSRVSATHGERLGLNPCAKAVAAPTKKYRNESLQKHGAWLKKLQKGMVDEQEKKATEEAKKVEKEARMKEKSAKYREEVRQMLKERNEAYDEQLDFERQQNRERRGLVPKSENKPLWAMTESEVADFDRAEAEDLINFAETLDYDKFINDLEVRECLAIMKDRVGHVKRMQENFKQSLVDEFNRAAEREDGESFIDDANDLGESASQVGSVANSGRRRAQGGNGGDRPDWDASSSVGDGGSQRDLAKAEMAKEILASNSQMRGVHSKESVQKIIDKQKAENSAPPSDV